MVMISYMDDDGGGGDGDGDDDGGDGDDGGGGGDGGSGDPKRSRLIQFSSNCNIYNLHFIGRFKYHTWKKLMMILLLTLIRKCG